MKQEYISHKRFPYYEEPSAGYWVAVCAAAMGILFAVSCKVAWLEECLDGGISLLSELSGLEKGVITLGLIVACSALTVVSIIRWHLRVKSYKRYYQEELKKLKPVDFMIILGQSQDEPTEKAIVEYLQIWQAGDKMEMGEEEAPGDDSVEDRELTELEKEL